MQLLLFRQGFNTQPPEGGWSSALIGPYGVSGFQHTAARRRLAKHRHRRQCRPRFQHTAARRRLEWGFFPADYFCEFQHTAARRRLAGDRHLPSSILGFNTQPPEGGWSMAGLSVRAAILFQHTAARRRLDPLRYHTSPLLYVSTHSRPKAAG